MVEVVLCNQPATRGALTAQSGGVGGGRVGGSLLVSGRLGSRQWLQPGGAGGRTPVILSPHIASVPTTVVTLVGLAGERADWWPQDGS